MTGSGCPLERFLEEARTWVQVPVRGSAEVKSPMGREQTLVRSPTPGKERGPHPDARGSSQGTAGSHAGREVMSLQPQRTAPPATVEPGPPLKGQRLPQPPTVGYRSLVRLLFTYNS